MTKEKGNKEFLTNSQVWNAYPALQQLLNQRFHVRVSMELAKLGTKLKPEVEALDQVRKSLLQKYQEKDKESGKQSIKPGTENMDNFIDEWIEALSQPSEIAKPDKIKIPDKVGDSCDKCKHNMSKPLEVEGSIIMALIDFIDIMEVE